MRWSARPCRRAPRRARNGTDRESALHHRARCGLDGLRRDARSSLRRRLLRLGPDLQELLGAVPASIARRRCPASGRIHPVRGCRSSRGPLLRSPSTACRGRGPPCSRTPRRAPTRHIKPACSAASPAQPRPSCLRQMGVVKRQWSVDTLTMHSDLRWPDFCRILPITEVAMDRRQMASL